MRFMQWPWIVGIVISVMVSSCSAAVAISAGRQHGCAVLNDGSVKCWGQSGYAQLGLGDTITRGDEPNEMGANLSAVDLGANRTAVTISAGYYYTCALLDGGSVKC